MLAESTFMEEATVAVMIRAIGERLGGVDSDGRGRRLVLLPP
jgi:hypothetical protein